MTGRHRAPRKPVHPKVKAGGAAGAAVVVAVWVAGLLGFHVPAEVAEAATVLAGVAAGYLKSA